MIWQSHMAYHPRIGVTYTPSFKGRLPHESGGYLLRSNTAGFRSEHEFAAQRAPGKFRVLLFGDSQTAGLGVSNRQRYSDLIERSTPGLEIFNFAIDGIGIDQEYLAYLEHRHMEHDLVVIGLYVEDIGRVSTHFLTIRIRTARSFTAPSLITKSKTMFCRSTMSRCQKGFGPRKQCHSTRCRLQPNRRGWSPERTTRFEGLCRIPPSGER